MPDFVTLEALDVAQRRLGARGRVVSLVHRVLGRVRVRHRDARHSVAEIAVRGLAVAHRPEVQEQLLVGAVPDGVVARVARELRRELDGLFDVRLRFGVDYQRVQVLRVAPLPLVVGRGCVDVVRVR